MRWIFLAGLVILIVGPTIGRATAGGSTAGLQVLPTGNMLAMVADQGAGYDQEAERVLITLANQARTQAGFVPLQADDGLTKAARQHADAMAARQQLSHQFPGEADLEHRLAVASNLQLDEVAENVGESDGARSAHEGFMHSPMHRANLLNSSYNAVGIGVVQRGPALYVVEDFGHSLPGYSSASAAKLIAQSVDQARDQANLPRLQHRDDTVAQAEACALARADSLRPTAPAQPGEARYILRFTSMDPQNLPAAAAKAAQDRGVAAYSAGSCFARTATYPNGAYWIVLRLY